MKVFSTNLRKAIAATIISPLAVIPAILIFTLISWLFDSDFVASDFELNAKPLETCIAQLSGDWYEAITKVNIETAP